MGNVEMVNRTRPLYDGEQIFLPGVSNYPKTQMMSAADLN